MTAPKTSAGRRRTGTAAATARTDTGDRADLIAVLAGVSLFAAAAVIGTAINDDNRLRLRWPPMYAHWEPHLGPGTLPALLTTVLVVRYGPALARRLSWRRLLVAAGAASLLWISSLAMIDGWRRGVVARLTNRHEYLRSVDDVTSVGAMLRGFTDHILIDAPDNWPSHVAGHPPGALLTFVGLDRIGLAGGGWAGMFCVVTAASTTVAVLLTVRALASEELARRATPFLVLAPAAVWLGVSADAYFAAVAAWGVALLTLAATRTVRAPWLAALGSGLLFGWLLHLSYGLVLMGLPCLTVLSLARNWRPLPFLLIGVSAWVAAFSAAGFWWFDGYLTVLERYHQGAARQRPYSYFVWANLAVQVLTVGLATVAALRRTTVALPPATRGAFRRLRAGGPVTGRTALVILVASGLCAMLVAGLSGMSKAETERIWLPFLLWLLPATALLPDRWTHRWLTVQAATALTVNHLWITGW